MQWIADNLFVGNKLTSGEIRTADGTRVDLRNIRSPIIVLCSWGDNITPPQQALGWVTDLYDHDDEIVANGQTIVYTLHQTIGHLGIFVSGKVATREHAEFASCMEMIDLLPPGLYEAVITEVDETTANPGLIHGKYLFRLEAAHARRHPRARRQQRRGRPAVRHRGARFRDQHRPLPDVRPAGRPGDGERTVGRPDARDASATACASPPSPIAIPSWRSVKALAEAVRADRKPGVAEQSAPHHGEGRHPPGSRPAGRATA